MNTIKTLCYRLNEMWSHNDVHNVNIKNKGLIPSSVHKTSSYERNVPLNVC